MKRPKSVKPKNWKLHLEVCEMNRDIIKRRMKDSMYIPDALDEMLFTQGDYKANKKKNGISKK